MSKETQKAVRKLANKYNAVFNPPLISYSEYTPIRSSEFSNKLGIQGDITQGNWSTTDSIIAQCSYIGATNLRSAAPTSNNWTLNFGHPQALAASGLKMDFIADTAVSPQDNASGVANFISQYPNSVSLMEGANEPNNFGFSYNNKTGDAAAVDFQFDLYNAMKANSATSGIPVAGMSSYPVLAAASDYNNIHVYPNFGDQPTQYIIGGYNEQNAVDPGKPFVITEMGYYTMPGVNSGNWSGVDEKTQGILMINAYMAALRLNVKLFSIYSLRNYGGSDIGAKFGFFNFDDTPKISASVFNNSKNVFYDSGANKNTFSVTPLRYQTDKPSDVFSLLFQKSSGQFVAVFWREPDIWNQSNGTQINTSGVNFSINLQSSANVKIYDPVVGSTPIFNQNAINSISVSVNCSPIYIEIT